MVRALWAMDTFRVTPRSPGWTWAPGPSSLSQEKVTPCRNRHEKVSTGAEESSGGTQATPVEVAGPEVGTARTGSPSTCDRQSLPPCAPSPEV